jgi:hypothetical protein
MRCGSPVSRFDATSWKFHTLSLSSMYLAPSYPPNDRLGRGDFLWVWFGSDLSRNPGSWQVHRILY